MRALPYRFELLFVNDGSRDGSKQFLLEQLRSHPDIRLVDLSRNFGHQSAVLAGLHHAAGDCAIMMDTDLQDRPEAIPALLEQWERGAQVVYAIRKKRKEWLPKRLLFAGFYLMLTRLSEVSIPKDAGLFSLLDRRVLDILTQLPERNRYLPGLRAWAGFVQTGIEVERDERSDGPPRVSVMQLLKLALDAIFSFSRIPLRIATALGAFSAFLAVAATAIVLYKKFISLEAIPGWTSTLLSILFLGAVQLFSLGILGEYLGRIYEEVKRRPPYLVKDIYGIIPPAGVPQATGEVPAEPVPVPQATGIPGEKSTG
jgi:dolichol-phosphate mannosyltransferase